MLFNVFYQKDFLGFCVFLFCFLRQSKFEKAENFRKAWSGAQRFRSVPDLRVLVLSRSKQIIWGSLALHSSRLIWNVQTTTKSKQSHRQRDIGLVVLVDRTSAPSAHQTKNIKQPKMELMVARSCQHCQQGGPVSLRESFAAWARGNSWPGGLRYLHGFQNRDLDSRGLGDWKLTALKENTQDKRGR